MKPKAIIVDMDGTICENVTGRPWYGEGAADGMLKDEPYTDIINLIHLEHKSAIFISSNIDEALSISDRVIILSKMPCRIIKEFRTDNNLL